MGGCRFISGGHSPTNRFGAGVEGRKSGEEIHAITDGILCLMLRRERTIWYDFDLALLKREIGMQQYELHFCQCG